MTTTPRVRVSGAGYTVFNWNGNLIAFAQEVRTTSPEPVAAAAPIQPLYAQRPLEVITSGAAGPGTLTMVLTELYNEAVWQRLAGLTNAQDVVDIMVTLAQNDPANAVKVQRIIRPPLPNRNVYMETYYGCVISRVGDGETINITSMQQDKEIDVMYTYSLKDWINGGARSNPFQGVT